MRCDLVILGGDPRARDAARAALRPGRRIVLVEPHRSAPRADRLSSTGRRAAEAGGKPLLAADLQSLESSGCDVLVGAPRFLDPHTLEVRDPHGARHVISADRILVASPAAPRTLPVCEGTHDDTATRSAHRGSDALRPASAIVVGGGASGFETAFALAAHGTDVVLVEAAKCLDGIDGELVADLRRSGRRRGICFQDGLAAVGLECDSDTGRCTVLLENGKRLSADRVEVRIGSDGASENLHLAAAGLVPDEHGKLWCDAVGRTWVGHIAAVGPLVGFPRRPGRAPHEVAHALAALFDRDVVAGPPRFRLETSPACEGIGPTELELLTAGTAARRTRLGSDGDYVKLLEDPRSGRLLAAHALGERARPAIDLAQSVLDFGGTADTLRTLLRDELGLEPPVPRRSPVPSRAARRPADPPRTVTQLVPARGAADPRRTRCRSARGAPRSSPLRLFVAPDE